jgi:hypothetical protein
VLQLGAGERSPGGKVTMHVTCHARAGCILSIYNH